MAGAAGSNFLGIIATNPLHRSVGCLIVAGERIEENSMSDQIVPGDVVKLKSGGPKMTVVAVDEAEFTGEMTAWCEWFEGGPVAKSASFSLIALRKWPPPEGPRIIRNDSGTSWMSN